MSEINGAIHENGLVDNSPGDLNGVPSTTNGTDNIAPNIEIPTATLKEIVVTDYIRESLDKVALAEGFRNYDISIDHGSSIGDGFVGIMIKAKIQELDIHFRHKSLTVLAKIPPQNQLRRQMMKSIDLFKREIYVYNILLPEFVKFQEDHKISKQRGFYNFAKVYYADYNEEMDDAIIIMEDLRERNCKMWSKYKPMNFEHSKLLISALGRLHGLSLAMKLKKPEIFEKFKELDDLFFKLSADNENFEFDKYLEINIRTAIEALDPNDLKKKQRAMKVLDGLIEQIKPCVDPKEAEPFSVVTHGDCWTNNFLFHYGARGAPEEIILIDWQVSRYCSPIIDLVNFLFICTDHEFRVKHWDELINIYHRSVREIVEHVGGDIMTQLPITALLRQLKKFGKYGVVVGAMLVPMLQVKNEELMDMDFMAEKMKDMDPAMMEEIKKQFEETTAASSSRLREIVEDAIKYGYL
jgi:thiamine kinase-like enzyme